MIGVLALINAYVFLWQGEGSLADLGDTRAAVIGADEANGVLGSFAAPREDACTGDPVRIFQGLDDALSVETTLAGGRTLRLALLDHGVAQDAINALEAAIRPSIDLGLLAGTGAPLRLALDHAGGVLALEAELSEGHLMQACRAADGFRVRTIQHPVSPEVATVSLELGDDADLFAAVAAADERPELAVLLAETLVDDVDFTVEARPRDRVTALVEKRFLGQSFHRYGHVLAVRYRGAAGNFAYYRYQPEGAPAAYYDRNGRPVARALRRTPLRFHPFRAEAREMLAPTLEVVEGRLGAIYRRPEGAPVVSLADGHLRSIVDDERDGHVIEIAHGDGTIARYSHLMRPFSQLEVGAPVRRGQLLGLAGHSGKTPTDRVRLELARVRDGAESTLDPLLPTASGEARPPVTGEALEGAALKRFHGAIRPWRKSLLRAG